MHVQASVGLRDLTLPLTTPAFTNDDDGSQGRLAVTSLIVSSPSFANKQLTQRQQHGAPSSVAQLVD